MCDDITLLLIYLNFEFPDFFWFDQMRICILKIYTIIYVEWGSLIAPPPQSQRTMIKLWTLPPIEFFLWPIYKVYKSTKNFWAKDIS